MDKEVCAYDVVIVGGGPAGSTVGCLLRKYNPSLSVLILERERFPRDHVGESQLPPVLAIVNEMGCWDEVEAAGFPIKIGATFRWGQDDALWDFELVPTHEVENQARPAPYAGFRAKAALQVDRSIYDKILLDHAAKLGVEVREETKVASVDCAEGRVKHLTLSDGEVITGRYFIDASGNSAILRRALDVPVTVTKSLMNIAIWDYWQNADWAVKIGVGGTRIQILSLPYGWLWFIPLGPTRTSIGLVTPAEHYRRSGQRPEELYRQALEDEPRVKGLLANATSEDKLATTRDWSFVSEKNAGENWFVVGEAAGFADPILSAGMTLAHVGARELAYTILELERGEMDPAWLRTTFDEQQRNRVQQHIRFADFWYTQNGCFHDLKDLTKEIASDAGHEMDPNDAFRWFASGSFTGDAPTAAVGNHGFATAKYIAQLISGQTADWEIAKYSHLYANLEGATKTEGAEYHEGRINRIGSYHRDGKFLRLSNLNQLIFNGLTQHSEVVPFMNLLAEHFGRLMTLDEGRERIFRVIEALEALLLEGWIVGKTVRGMPVIQMQTPTVPGPIVHPNVDEPRREAVAA